MPSWAIWKPQRVVGISEEKRIVVKIHYREEKLLTVQKQVEESMGANIRRYIEVFQIDAIWI